MDCRLPGSPVPGILQARDPRCSPRGNPACRGTFGGRRKAVRAFRMNWLDLLAVQGTLKSLLQLRSSKASILQCPWADIGWLMLLPMRLISGGDLEVSGKQNASSDSGFLLLRRSDGVTCIGPLHSLDLLQRNWRACVPGNEGPRALRRSPQLGHPPCAVPGLLLPSTLAPLIAR